MCFVGMSADCYDSDRPPYPCFPLPAARRATVSSPMAARPTIIRNPANDRDLQAAIEEILHSGLSEPAAMEERLRQRYPRAVVRPRELADERTPVWYVYREGRWVSGD